MTAFTTPSLKNKPSGPVRWLALALFIICQLTVIVPVGMLEAFAVTLL